MSLLILEKNDFANEKREIIIQATIGLIIEKGYERTTTREIASEASMSFGSVFKYFGCKENILISVIESIYADLLCKIQEFESIEVEGYIRLNEIIEFLVRIYDEMKDEILIILQEFKSIPKESQNLLLKNEDLLNKAVEDLIRPCLEVEESSRSKKNTYLLSQNIRMIAQLWTLQYRSLKREVTMEEYITSQASLIANSLMKGQ
ncbi:TetR/AcrR family transcriptional regulator [Anaerobacillus sp. MEB173]|uniref:TetR/AcrR family transcriptional regulator n=1 Tax=Anaerobacillus sp. MEB173 TaxID=3383345 RepID=UPI003F8F3419